MSARGPVGYCALTQPPTERIRPAHSPAPGPAALPLEAAHSPPPSAPAAPLSPHLPLLHAPVANPSPPRSAAGQIETRLRLKASLMVEYMNVMTQ
jgi:hypothetical protein